MSAVAGVTLLNAVSRPGHERGFWALMTLGFSLWTCNQAAWTYHDIILHRQIPDPSFYDVILFFHAVPLIAAVAWRPDLLKKEGKIHLSLLNFLMLLGWWVFLYAFLVVPHQYVALNVKLYDLHYDRLYLLENALLLAVLGPAVHRDDRALARVVEQYEGARGRSIGTECVLGIDAALFEFCQEIVAHRVAADRADETYVVPSRAEPACHVGRAPPDPPSQRLGIDLVAGGGDALNTQDNDPTRQRRTQRPQPCTQPGTIAHRAATRAGTRRLRLLSATGFSLTSILDRQSSRLATAQVAWPKSRRASGARPCPRQMSAPWCRVSLVAWLFRV